MMPEKEIKLRSNEVQEILTKIPHWLIRYGNLVLLLFILLLLGLSWFIRYPDVVTGGITVTASAPVEHLEATTAGRLQEICVKEGTQVAASQVLAVFENDAALQDVMLLKEFAESLAVEAGKHTVPMSLPEILRLGEIQPAFDIFNQRYTAWSQGGKGRPDTMLYQEMLEACRKLDSSIASWEYRYVVKSKAAGQIFFLGAAIRGRIALVRSFLPWCPALRSSTRDGFDLGLKG